MVIAPNHHFDTQLCYNVNILLKHGFLLFTNCALSYDQDDKKSCILVFFNFNSFGFWF